MTDRCYLCGEPWPCDGVRISEYVRGRLASWVVSKWERDMEALDEFQRDDKQVPTPRQAHGEFWTRR
jgi:hypothetical protein